MSEGSTRHRASRTPTVRTALAVGLGAGFLSGLFGIGGGVLLVPGLVMLSGMPQRVAHGTSLAAVLPISLAALSGYAFDGKVDWQVAAILAVGAMVGAVVGTHLLHRIPHDVLSVLFIAILVVTVARMVFADPHGSGRAALGLIEVLALLVVGLFTGILAGLLGVGGGVIMVPAMVLGFGLAAAIAKGTSLAVIVPTAITGTVRNWRRHNVDLRSAAIVGLCGVASAFAGSALSVRLSERVSNTLFAALIIGVALQMTVRLARGRRRRPVNHAARSG